MPGSHVSPSYKSGSGWNALLPKRKVKRQPPNEKHFDAIVIGAGVTGLAAARRLAELEPQSRVLLVDANEIGEGSSARSSGFLINLPHNTGMAGHGSPTDVARKQITLYNAGLVGLKSLIDRETIACSWNPAGKYHAAATVKGEKSLRQTLELYREWGIDYQELTPSDLKARLGTGYYRYGYHSESNVFVQPAAFVRGLADCLPNNVYLWECAPVLALIKGLPHKIITTSRELTAPRVLVANNGFARKLDLAKDRVFTIYTYAGLTPELDENELARLGSFPEWGVIPANRLGTTLRRTSAGRLMVRSAYSYERERPLSEIRTLLQDCYQHRYPTMRSYALEYVWGGVTALTRNGALYFGKIANGLYISIGCNGAGLLKGSVFGQLLAEMASGHQSPELADALGFQRPTWLPPEPIRCIAVTGTIQYQKRKAGLER